MVSNSEEEEDEEAESCHSSSSDTLTCSIPEVNLRNDYVREACIWSPLSFGFHSKMIHIKTAGIQLFRTYKIKSLHEYNIRKEILKI